MHQFTLTAILFLMGCWLGAPVKAIADDSRPATIPDIRAHLIANGQIGEPAAGNTNPGVLVWPRKMGLSSTNFYGPDGVRYLIVELVIGNDTNTTLSLRPSDIAVDVAGEPARPGDDVPREVSRLPLKLETDLISTEERQHPEVIEIAPGAISQFYVTFAPLPNQVEQQPLMLSISAGSFQTKISLAEYAAREAKLETQLIGPKNCLALVHIAGRLNSISAGTLATTLQQLHQQSVERVVIYWDGAPESPGAESAESSFIDPAVVNWLLNSATSEGTDDPYYHPMPRLPGFRELHLVRPPVADDDLNPSETGPQVFSSLRSAIQRAVRSLLPYLDEALLLQQLKEGDRRIQLAIMNEPGTPLPSAAYETLQRFARGPDKGLRMASLVAMERLYDERIVGDLTDAVKHSPIRRERQAALISLVRSYLPGATAAVKEMVDTHQLPAATWSIRGLSETAQLTYGDWFEQQLSHPKANIRRSALQALAEIEAPHLVDRAITLLDDPSKPVQQAALSILVGTQSVRGRQAAIDHCLAHLDQLTLTNAVEQLISQSGDPRFAPMLLRQLEQPDDEVGYRLMYLLTQIGDDAVARELIKRYPQAPLTLRRTLMEFLGHWRLPEVMDLALREVSNEDLEISEAAGGILVADGSEQAWNALESTLLNCDEDHFAMLCQLVQNIGSVDGKRLLISLRDHYIAQDNLPRVQATLTNLEYMQQHSPGWNAVENGMYRSRDEEYEMAIRQYQLASQIDPELSIAHSNSGNAYMKLEQFKEAGESFRKAIELNPYDGQAITGWGIALSLDGKPEEAVEFVNRSAKYFSDNYIFEYNTACVYGRAIEALLKRPEAGPRNELIQQYSKQAIEHLKTSLTGGFDDFDLLASDPDLDTLRDHPDFASLRDFVVQ